MTTKFKKLTESEYKTYLHQNRLDMSDKEIENIIDRLKNKQIFEVKNGKKYDRRTKKGI